MSLGTVPWPRAIASQVGSGAGLRCEGSGLCDPWSQHSLCQMAFNCWWKPTAPKTALYWPKTTIWVQKHHSWCQHLQMLEAGEPMLEALPGSTAFIPIARCPAEVLLPPSAHGIARCLLNAIILKLTCKTHSESLWQFTAVLGITS